MKCMKKSEIQTILDNLGEKRKALLVVRWTEHNGRVYLKANSQNGLRTIGRLPKSVFNWFDLEVYDAPYMNQIRYQFK